MSNSNKNNFRLIVPLLLLIAILLFLKLSSKKEETKNVSQEAVKVSENSADKYIVLDKTLIAKHNKANDCWLYIDDSVYIVTSFLQFHSGGPDRISPYCGANATDAFKSRDHSEGARELLKRLNIGKIDQKVLIEEVKKVENDNLSTP